MWGFPWFFKKSKPMILGIDASHFQGHVQWSEVAKDPQNITYAFLKATEGQTYVDSALKYNATEAKKAGLKIGYYHFATLNSQDIIGDAVAEANFFIDTIKKCPVPELPLALDIETNKAGLSPEQVQLWIRSFFVQLEKRDHKDYVLYSYTPFLNANLPKDHLFGNIRLWLAAYTTGLNPRLPIGWTDYWLWQFSAKGRVKGCNTPIDMNRFKT